MLGDQIVEKPAISTHSSLLCSTSFVNEHLVQPNQLRITGHEIAACIFIMPQRFSAVRCQLFFWHATDSPPYLTHYFSFFQNPHQHGTRSIKADLAAEYRQPGQHVLKTSDGEIQRTDPPSDPPGQYSSPETKAVHHFICYRHRIWSHQYGYCYTTHPELNHSHGRLTSTLLEFYINGSSWSGYSYNPCRVDIRHASSRWPVYMGE